MTNKLKHFLSLNEFLNLNENNVEILEDYDNLIYKKVKINDEGKIIKILDNFILFDKNKGVKGSSIFIEYPEEYIKQRFTDLISYLKPVKADEKYFVIETLKGKGDFKMSTYDKWVNDLIKNNNRLIPESFYLTSKYPIESNMVTNYYIILSDGKIPSDHITFNNNVNSQIIELKNFIKVLDNNKDKIGAIHFNDSGSSRGSNRVFAKDSKKNIAALKRRKEQAELKRKQGGTNIR